MSSYPYDQSTEPMQQSQGTAGGSPTMGSGSMGGLQYETEFEPSGTPPIDLVDNTDEIWVYVDLPGFREDEIQIQGDETTLQISADRPGDIEEGRTVVVHERPYKVERTVPLVAPVDVDDATATFEDGVCKIMLPKASSKQYQRIDFE